MTAFALFGDPARFEIALRWLPDDEPREHRPAHGGWSMGELRLTVGHHVLTRHLQAGQAREAMRWYLLPLFEWLCANWTHMLHEERFSWMENGWAPAAPTVLAALKRWIATAEPSARQSYRDAHAWWSRHALRAADPSALYPDVVFRRLGEDVEVSWTARQPICPPNGFRLELAPGAAVLPMADVAGPLWEALAWAVSASHPQELNEADRESILGLERQIARLAEMSAAEIETACLPATLFERAKEAEVSAGLRADTSVRMEKAPALSRIDDAVLMFGGVSPAIGLDDARMLTHIMGLYRGGRDSAELAALVDHDVGAPLRAPHTEGAELALDLLEVLGLPRADSSSVGVETIARRLGVEIVYRTLKTDTIRGAALAGDGYKPAILVNETSHYNVNEAGRRFTIAHELFHILYDRARARRIAHSSGPWAPPGVEKRANAFAAMLLMPPILIARVSSEERWTREAVRRAADSMQVGALALLEHLYNIELIAEDERNRLRAEFSRQAQPARHASGRVRPPS